MPSAAIQLEGTGLGGTPIAGGSSQVTEAKNGKDIVLSLDLNLQDEAEKQLSQVNRNELDL